MPTAVSYASAGIRGLGVEICTEDTTVGLAIEQAWANSIALDTVGQISNLYIKGLREFFY